MKDKYHEPLSEWQKRNCTGCRFADMKTIGTGKPCCTYGGPGVFEMDEEGECKTRRSK